MFWIFTGPQHGQPGPGGVDGMDRQEMVVRAGRLTCQMAFSSGEWQQIVSTLSPHIVWTQVVQESGVPPQQQDVRIAVTPAS